MSPAYGGDSLIVPGTTSGRLSVHPSKVSFLVIAVTGRCDNRNVKAGESFLALTGEHREIARRGLRSLCLLAGAYKTTAVNFPYASLALAGRRSLTVEEMSLWHYQLRGTGCRFPG